MINSTLLRTLYIEVSDTRGTSLRTDNDQKVLVKVSQFCSCLGLVKHVGYQTISFFTRVSFLLLEFRYILERQDKTVEKSKIDFQKFQLF